MADNEDFSNEEGFLELRRDVGNRSQFHKMANKYFQSFTQLLFDACHNLAYCKSQDEQKTRMSYKPGKKTATKNVSLVHCCRLTRLAQS